MIFINFAIINLVRRGNIEQDLYYNDILLFLAHVLFLPSSSSSGTVIILYWGMNAGSLGCVSSHSRPINVNSLVAIQRRHSSGPLCSTSTRRNNHIIWSWKIVLWSKLYIPIITPVDFERRRQRTAQYTWYIRFLHTSLPGCLFVLLRKRRNKGSDKMAFHNHIEAKS